VGKGSIELTQDAYYGLDHLAALPYVRGDQIAAIGFSLGASILNSFIGLRDRNPDKRDFAAAIAVNGHCSALYDYSTDQIPVMQILGEMDKERVQSCLALQQRPMEVHIIAGAYNSFDQREITRVTINSSADLTLYSAEATQEARTLIKGFLAKHLGR
jgi:dienelactone hydrolase